MSATSSHSDYDLLKQIAQGEEWAFRELYERYRDKLYFFIYNLTESRQTAEDGVQEVFIKVWLQREQLPHLENWMGWMHRVAYNHTINGLKRLAMEGKIKAGLSAERPAKQPGSDARLIKQDMEKWLREAIEQLPPQQRLIYKLSREEGLTYQEIGAQLSISPLTVKKHMNQALKTLRQQLNQGNTLGPELAAIALIVFGVLK